MKPERSSSEALIALLGYLALASIVEAFSDAPEPEFAAPVSSLRVHVGSDAVLKCIVDNLGHYKVMWLRVTTQELLSIHGQVLSRTGRLNVTSPDGRTWYLHIRNTNLGDNGYYACQINTQPLKMQAGYLEVVEPPEFVTNMTNRSITVTEHQDVSISCKATGSPAPTIQWKREDGQPFFVNGTKVRVYKNEELYIEGVTRKHMAAYLCLASNGVPPPISRRIYLDVTFPPLIWIQNQIVGAPVGTDVSMECHVEAHPPSDNYWTRENEPLLQKSERYKTYLSRNSYKVHMRLTIKNLQPEDYGAYKCVANNTLGETAGSVTLHKLKIPFSVQTQRAFTELPTFAPKRTTVAEHTTGAYYYHGGFSTDASWRDILYFPGRQQKFGDGRSTDTHVPEMKDAACCRPPNSRLSVIGCVILLSITRWIS